MRTFAIIRQCSTGTAQLSNNSVLKSENRAISLINVLCDRYRTLVMLAGAKNGE